MKKILFAIAIILLTKNVYALNTIETEINENGYYINNKEILITEELYEKIDNILEYDEIVNMNDNLYEIVSSGEILSSQVKYIKTEKFIDANGNDFVETIEVEKEEFYNMNPNTRVSCGTGCWQTDYKRIRLIFTKETTNPTYSDEHNIYISNEWKKMPEHRSFDILALRWSGNVNVMRYSGAQDYNTTGVTETITYDMNSANFQRTNSGIGLSQNLVNNSNDYYNSMSVKVRAAGNITIFGTYQHAQGNLTLVESQSYTFGNGLGGVLVFYNTNIRDIYDNTTGLTLTKSI